MGVKGTLPTDGQLFWQRVLVVGCDDGAQDGQSAFISESISERRVSVDTVFSQNTDDSSDRRCTFLHVSIQDGSG